MTGGSDAIQKKQPPLWRIVEITQTQLNFVSGLTRKTASSRTLPPRFQRKINLGAQKLLSSRGALDYFKKKR